MALIKILLDTNFLIYCAENKIDYMAEIDKLMVDGYEFAIPRQVPEELKNLAQKAAKFSDKTAAWVALRILEKNNVKIIDVEGKTADEAIIKMIRVGTIIATLDEELRKKIGYNNRILIVKRNKIIDFD